MLLNALKRQHKNIFHSKKYLLIVILSSLSNEYNFHRMNPEDDNNKPTEHLRMKYGTEL